MELQDYVYSVIFLTTDGEIISIYDNKPTFPKGFEIPEELAHDSYYLLITNKQSGITEVTHLHETGQSLFRKGPVFLAIDKAAKSGLQTIPQEDKEIFDQMEFDRWYSVDNASGIIELLRKQKENGLKPIEIDD